MLERLTFQCIKRSSKKNVYLFLFPIFVFPHCITLISNIMYLCIFLNVYYIGSKTDYGFSTHIQPHTEGQVWEYFPYETRLTTDKEKELCSSAKTYAQLETVSFDRISEYDETNTYTSNNDIQIIYSQIPVEWNAHDNARDIEDIACETHVESVHSHHSNSTYIKTHKPTDLVENNQFVTKETPFHNLTTIENTQPNHSTNSMYATFNSSSNSSSCSKQTNENSSTSSSASLSNDNMISASELSEDVFPNIRNKRLLERKKRNLGLKYTTRVGKQKGN